MCSSSSLSLLHALFNLAGTWYNDCIRRYEVYIGAVEFGRARILYHLGLEKFDGSSQFYAGVPEESLCPSSYRTVRFSAVKISSINACICQVFATSKNWFLRKCVSNRKFPEMVNGETKSSVCGKPAEQDGNSEQNLRAELRERFLRSMSFLGGKQVCFFISDL